MNVLTSIVFIQGWGLVFVVCISVSACVCVCVCACRFMNGFFSHVKQWESKICCQWERMLAFTPSSSSVRSRLFLSLASLLGEKGGGGDEVTVSQHGPEPRTSTTFPLPWRQDSPMFSSSLITLGDDMVPLHSSHVPTEPERENCIGNKLFCHLSYFYRNNRVCYS